jgi:hypothetical protein
MTNYARWNTILGWGVFLVASMVYLLTLESTVSLWDCGEYITAAYKLEVGHPPGAPLFMVLGRLFSFFAAPENVAVWINRLSAFSSSFTILFMFWSLTLFVKKMILSKKSELTSGDQMAIFLSAGVGALAYTFSDSFWFSAVEGEVYAMASLFTAVVFWAILKWDEEMALIQNGTLSLDQSPNRWLILILFLLGLAIGVHLLGILVIPAICFVIYFRVYKESSIKGLVLTGVLSIFLLGFIQEGIIAGSISLASSFEVVFVNSLGLPFYSGTIFFFILLIAVCLFFVRYARKKGKTILYNSFMGLIFLLIGYGSFAVIVIRSNANTPLDENDPENLVTLHSYLKREQYGSAPILYGNYWNSLKKGEIMTEEGPELTNRDDWKDLSPYFLRRFVISENDEEVKAFTDEKDAAVWMKENDGVYSMEEKYYESNSSVRKDAVATYEQGTVFPRMYSGDNQNHIQGYQKWSGYDPSDGTDSEIGRDGKRLPSFIENLSYFFSYQVNWMYIRYFMWNFAGRQNDIQGHGDDMRGNWISGINFLDEARLGSQEFAPHYTIDNASHNKFFLLPLILALIGLFFHFSRAPKDAFVILLAFLFTGVAILVYLNQKPFEPRERDYAYAGSFYFFAMWIGIGVYAIYDFVQRKKILAQDFQRAVIAGSIGLVIPVLMAYQGWDDHDRSGKTSAHDLSHNYLESCGKNGIIFTNGDNDTFPLWYLQEVEGQRTDVRVCNLSLMGTDWYTNQMKMKAYDSDPLPINFREDQILMYAGNTDQIYFINLLELVSRNSNEDMLRKIVDLRLKNNKQNALQAIQLFNVKVAAILPNISCKNPDFELAKGYLNTSDSSDLSGTILKKYFGAIKLFQGIQSQEVEFIGNAGQDLQSLLQEFETPWSSVDFKDAMAFVRDDKNFLLNGGGKLSFFPSSRFTLKVNKKNALAAGTITESQVAKCDSNILFEFNTERDSYLTRDEVMMMDIVANNDWKRGIYFSSNRGSSFSIALLSAGYIKQVGVAYELSPMGGEPMFYNLSKMYKNITQTYEYGKMNDPKVLTDYYARRHTQQYRSNFLLLAEQFIAKKDFKKAIFLLDKSLELMPLENVLDFGEVNQCDPFTSLKINSSHLNYSYQGEEANAKCSGSLHEYVQLYFLAGNKKKATDLGLKLMANYESIFSYFENSSASFAANPENNEDLIAALDACFKMYFVASDKKLGGDSKGKLATTIYKSINRVYKKIIPRIYADLENSSTEGNMQLINLKINLGGMAEHYGFSKTSAPKPVTTPNEIDLNGILKQ